MPTQTEIRLARKTEKESAQCQGWRRYGGAFTLGPVTWKQCSETPTVMLTVDRKQMAACPTCWQESIDNKIVIQKATPLNNGELNEK